MRHRCSETKMRRTINDCGRLSPQDAQRAADWPIMRVQAGYGVNIGNMRSVLWGTVDGAYLGGNVGRHLQMFVVLSAFNFDESLVYCIRQLAV